MAKCKKCNAEIKFVKNSRGKWHPCNPELLDSRNCPVGTVLIHATLGTVEVVRENTQMLYHIQGYESHFSTCPYADDFRKEK